MLKKEFLSFCMVGGFGFFVDAGVFQAADWLIGNPYVARLISYVSAATFTWYFNRKITFGAGLNSNGMVLEWLKFLYTQGFGFVMNYGIFSALVTYTSLFKQYPIAAIAAATIPSLFINFLSAKYLVFKKNGKAK